MAQRAGKWRSGRHSEQLEVVQRLLLDESIDGDIAAISLEIEAPRESMPKEAASCRTASIVPAPGNLP
jgi:hypothetical protein